MVYASPLCVPPLPPAGCQCSSVMSIQLVQAPLARRAMAKATYAWKVAVQQQAQVLMLVASLMGVAATRPCCMCVVCRGGAGSYAAHESHFVCRHDDGDTGQARTSSVLKQATFFPLFTQATFCSCMRTHQIGFTAEQTLASAGVAANCSSMPIASTAVAATVLPRRPRVCKRAALRGACINSTASSSNSAAANGNTSSPAADGSAASGSIVAALASPSGCGPGMLQSAVHSSANATMSHGRRRNPPLPPAAGPGTRTVHRAASVASTLPLPAARRAAQSARARASSPQAAAAASHSRF
jgi:hypothetical protein